MMAYGNFKNKIELVKIQSCSSDDRDTEHFRLFINLHMGNSNSKDILQGEIHCEGQFYIFQIMILWAAHWNLLAVNTIGNAQLQAGEQSFQLAGHMYFDQNCSMVPMTDLGIAKWFWGRFSFKDFEWIVYVVDSESNSNTVKLLLRLGKDGNIKFLMILQYPTMVQNHPFMAFNIQRLCTYRQMKHLFLSLGHKVDDSPFYQRFMVMSHFENQSGVGFVEQVVPSKIGIPWQQPFVRMKVHHLNAPNSFWLPLFSQEIKPVHSSNY